MSNPIESGRRPLDGSAARTAPEKLTIEMGEYRVPACLWLPHAAPRALVQACHGGSGHKESRAIVAIADELLPLGIAVLAIDGPVHGDRRDDGNLDPGVARQSFRDAWRAGIGRFSMADDMSAALDRVLQREELATLPVGYIGVSMGTAYGIPYLANDKRVRAAAIGLWSTTYAASEHLAEQAAGIECATWFTQQWNDEFFDRNATHALFDAIGTQDKVLVAYPEPHIELEGKRLKAAVAFIADQLLCAV